MRISKIKKLSGIIVAVGIAGVAILVSQYQNCAPAGGGGTPNASYTATPVNTASSFTIVPTTATVSLGGTYQFSATGGSGNYTYLVSPPGSGSVTSSGLFTAPTSATVMAVTAQDVATLATSAATVTVSTGPASTPIYTPFGTPYLGSTICTTAATCSAAVHMTAEIDGGTPAAANAQGVCNVVQGAGSVLVTYQTTSHSISCGKNYGLAEYVGSAFVAQQVPICGSGYVSVMSLVICQ